MTLLRVISSVHPRSAQKIIFLIRRGCLDLVTALRAEGPSLLFVRNRRKRWATSDGGNRTAGTPPPRIANRPIFSRFRRDAVSPSQLGRACAPLGDVPRCGNPKRSPWEGRERAKPVNLRKYFCTCPQYAIVYPSDDCTEHLQMSRTTRQVEALGSRLFRQRFPFYYCVSPPQDLDR
ncbi:hypothetical protein BHE74_00028870 [Ensete ventricosum]|nr:hypothetical protein GW17_00041929 [Ensete ventricosum]RWW63927.1 hypothetical protein BHE74_00028870 [Ensete ventricosum]RZR93205.1 hypothetical protein BHM03_00021644 [Ensete ventricosum]